MRSTDDSALRTVQFDESSTRSSFFIEKKLKTRLHAVSDTQSHTLLNRCLAYKTFVKSKYRKTKVRQKVRPKRVWSALVDFKVFEVEASFSVPIG